MREDRRVGNGAPCRLPHRRTHISFLTPNYPALPPIFRIPSYVGESVSCQYGLGGDAPDGARHPVHRRHVHPNAHVWQRRSEAEQSETDQVPVERVSNVAVSRHRVAADGAPWCPRATPGTCPVSPASAETILSRAPTALTRI